jgi:hypothetical protein
MGGMPMRLAACAALVLSHMLPMVALPPATEGAPTEVRYGWQFLQ